MSWDKYFFDLCEVVASNSKCFSRKVGAIIVKDQSVISTGYNGPPRGIPHCNERFLKDRVLIQELKKHDITVDNFYQCPRKVLGFKSGQGIEWCNATHAEVNTVVNAARLGVCVNGATLYLNLFIPCSKCMQVILNVGIKEIVVTTLEVYDGLTPFLIKNSDIIIRTFNF